MSTSLETELPRCVYNAYAASAEVADINKSRVNLETLSSADKETLLKYFSQVPFVHPRRH